MLKINQIHTQPRVSHSQASPQSSPASSLGFVSMTFAGTAFGLTIAASFFAPAPEPTLPVVVLLIAGGRPLLVAGAAGAGFANPFGNSPLGFDFACACAVSQPSKSGSPPSSKDVGASFTFSEGASKNESSAMSPQASSSSLSSFCASLKNWSVNVRVNTGAEGLERACL